MAVRGRFYILLATEKISGVFIIVYIANFLTSAPSEPRLPHILKRAVIHQNLSYVVFSSWVLSSHAISLNPA